MNILSWFLFISLPGTDQVLVKKVDSSEECIMMQTKLKKELINFEITCEEGFIVETEENFI